MNAQQLTGIMEFIPTNYECAALERYRKEENNSVCCECEKFMVSMMTLDDAHKKTQTMLFMLQFPISIEDIRSGKYKRSNSLFNGESRNVLS